MYCVHISCRLCWIKRPQIGIYECPTYFVESRESPTTKVTKLWIRTTSHEARNSLPYVAAVKWSTNKHHIQDCLGMSSMPSIKKFSNKQKARVHGETLETRSTTHSWSRWSVVFMVTYGPNPKTIRSAPRITVLHYVVAVTISQGPAMYHGLDHFTGLWFWYGPYICICMIGPRSTVAYRCQEEWKPLSVWSWIQLKRAYTLGITHRWMGC